MHGASEFQMQFVALEDAMSAVFAGARPADPGDQRHGSAMLLRDLILLMFECQVARLQPVMRAYFGHAYSQPGGVAVTGVGIDCFDLRHKTEPLPGRIFKRDRVEEFQADAEKRLKPDPAFKPMSIAVDISVLKT